MSTAVFPTLQAGWPITRTSRFNTNLQTNISGKVVVAARQIYPVYQWDLVFNILRQGTVNGVAQTELATLLGFFNQRQGRFDSFLYQDQDDNSVVNQGIGIGDGVTTAFPLVRAFGGFEEFVTAPKAISAVTVGGTPTSAYTFTQWGSTTPGIVTFSSAPTASAAILASFTYYFPCRFSDDKYAFAKIMSGYYQLKKMSWNSIL